MIRTLKKILKRSKFLRRKVQEVKEKNRFNPNIGEILPITPRMTDYDGLRINILVPSINQEHIFGGISTALKFYEKFADYTNCARRIITTDAEPMQLDLAFFKKYTCVSANENIEADFQIVPFSNRFNRTIPVGKNDIFITTAWWTAYNAEKLIEWQANIYQQETKKMIYFIQDYEPGFYPWSSRYVLADSTYKSAIPKVAIFNSKQLYDFFEQNGYEFNEKYYFDPKLNEQLKKSLLNSEMVNRKKQILIYGRPGVPRNAFEVILEALKSWVLAQPDIHEWKIYSVGEKHPNVELGNEMQLVSLGKLTLEEYARFMKESYVGISLMISPHPSYPPMEMATFGMKVLTNSYANKNLESFNGNIHSLDNVSPQEIEKYLLQICNDFKSKDENVIVENEYLDSSNPFDFIEKIHIN